MTAVQLAERLLALRAGRSGSGAGRSTGMIGRHRGASRHGPAPAELLYAPDVPVVALWPHEGSVAAALTAAVAQWAAASRAGERSVLPNGLAALGASWPTSAPRAGKINAIVARRLSAVSSGLRQGWLPGEDGRRATDLLVCQVAAFWHACSALPPGCAAAMDVAAGSAAGRRLGPAEHLAGLLLDHWDRCEDRRTTDVALPLLQLELSDFWARVATDGPAPHDDARFQLLVRDLDEYFSGRAAEAGTADHRLRATLEIFTASLHGDR